MTGTPIRQDFLETAISWLFGDKIEQYMSDHQHDPNANELWSYFQAVISWVELTFTTYRKEMKTIDWGTLYNLSQVRQAFRDRRDGSGPHHPVVEAREDKRSQLPDAVPGGQPTQRRSLGGKPGAKTIG